MKKLKLSSAERLSAIEKVLPKYEKEKTKFGKGAVVKHKRGNITENNILVSGVVEKPKDKIGQSIAKFPQSYIIEHPNGWTPNQIRIAKYGLDPAKKYLFVTEAELS